MNEHNTTTTLEDLESMDESKLDYCYENGISIEDANLWTASPNTALTAYASNSMPVKSSQKTRDKELRFWFVSAVRLPPFVALWMREKSAAVSGCHPLNSLFLNHSKTSFGTSLHP
jgi:hypothetical protein